MTRHSIDPSFLNTSEDKLSCIELDFSEERVSFIESILIEKSETTSITFTEDISNLRKVTDKIPTACRVVIFCEFCDRFTLFGIMAILQNYIQFPLPTNGSQQPGVMGKGEKVATALTLFFSFITYSTLIVGAVIADVYWGKYKTIIVFGIIYALGPFILTITSIPQLLDTSAPFVGLIVAILLMGLGRGGVKSNYTVAAAEQYPHKEPYIKTLETGERVIVDPEITIQSIFNWLYVLTSLGMLSPFITTPVEKFHSFWLAYLICFVVFLLSNLVFYFKNKEFNKIPPNGSIFVDAFKIFSITLRSQSRSLDSAKPSNMNTAQLSEYHVKWDDNFVDDLKKGLQACSLFLFYPTYWAAWSQSRTNMISQGATMRSENMPNDLMTNIVPLAAGIVSIIVDKLFYPTLRKHGVSLLPTSKIFIGFVFMALAMVYCAVLQLFIYRTGPCYEHTLCIIDGKMVPNDISIWWQTPGYFMIAVSEVFVYITALEYAYHKAPKSMESIVTALFFTTDGVGSALGLIMVPFSHDPYTIYAYITMSVITCVAGTLLVMLFRRYDIESSSAVKNNSATEGCTFL
ncbi:938_t:CDS:2 [Ambispora gerdemannii]|uniref:938_t:CDS:1 n=1 Tax=Ambispora gerdemannii TaxID=144530 RepID=A0A9N9CFY5_9GLOM|nr:938_t:CDS:2 [Ambispora gerdemannii]